MGDFYLLLRVRLNFPHLASCHPFNLDFILLFNCILVSSESCSNLCQGWVDLMEFCFIPSLTNSAGFVIRDWSSPPWTDKSFLQIDCLPIQRQKTQASFRNFTGTQTQLRYYGYYIQLSVFRSQMMVSVFSLYLSFNSWCSSLDHGRSSSLICKLSWCPKGSTLHNIRHRYEETMSNIT